MKFRTHQQRERYFALMIDTLISGNIEDFKTALQPCQNPNFATS